MVFIHNRQTDQLLGKATTRDPNMTRNALVRAAIQNTLDETERFLRELGRRAGLHNKPVPGIGEKP